MGAGGHGHAGVAVEVCVAVLVPTQGVHGARVIDRAVTVVVEAIAELGRGRVDRAVGVVAVGGVGNVAGGLRAGVHGRGGVAVQVRVVVQVPGERVQGARLVDRAVTVVVEAIAQLGGGRVDRAVGVIAVGAGGEAVPVGVGVARRPVAVVVVGVGTIGLHGRGIPGGVGVVAVATGGHVPGRLIAGLDRHRVVAERVPIGVGEPGREAVRHRDAGARLTAAAPGVGSREAQLLLAERQRGRNARDLAEIVRRRRTVEDLGARGSPREGQRRSAIVVVADTAGERDRAVDEHDGAVGRGREHHEWSGIVDNRDANGRAVLLGIAVNDVEGDLDLADGRGHPRGAGEPLGGDFTGSNVAPCLINGPVDGELAGVRGVRVADLRRQREHLPEKEGLTLRGGDDRSARRGDAHAHAHVRSAAEEQEHHGAAGMAQV